MSKGLKVGLWVIAVAALLAVAAFVAVKFFVTEERVRSWVIPPLEEKLGRKVNFESVDVGFTGFALSNFDVRAAAAPEPLVAAESVEIAWRLMPLLSGRLEVDNVSVVAPAIHIERLKDGTLNIDDLLNKGTPDSPSEVKEGGAAPEGKGGIAVAVARLSVVGASAGFIDRMPVEPLSYSIEDLDVEVLNLSNSAPFDFTLSAKLPTIGAALLAAKGRIDPLAKALKVNISLASVDLKRTLALAGETPVAGGTLAMNVDFSGRERRMADLSGDIKVSGLLLEEGGRRGEPTDISLSTKLSCPMDSNVIAVEKLALNAGGQLVDGTGEFVHSDTPVIKLSLKSPKISIDRLLAILPPAGDGDLSKSKSQGGKAAKAAEPSPIPVEGVVDLSVDELSASGFRVEKVKATTTLKDSRVTLNPMSANLYGGAFGGVVSANLKSAGPPVKMDLSLSGVELSGLLGAVDQKFKNSVTGNLSGKVKGSAVGGDMEKLDVVFNSSSTEGKLYNHPAVSALASALKAPELEELNFYDLRLDGSASGGVAHITSGRLNGPDMRVEAKGTAGLIDRNLSLGVTAAVPEKIAKRVIGDKRVREALSDSEGWTKVPFKVRGNMAAPKIMLDDNAVGKAAGNVLGKEVEKKIQKAVGDKFDAGGLLKGLLGN